MDNLNDNDYIYNKFNLNSINKNLLEKIELEYLNNELKFKEIDNLSEELQLDSNSKILLCPVSDKSFTNYYRSIITKNIDECYWGLKFGNNEKIWTKLSPNDFIVLVEKEMITLGIITELEKRKGYTKDVVEGIENQQLSDAPNYEDEENRIPF